MLESAAEPTLCRLFDTAREKPKSRQLARPLSPRCEFSKSLGKTVMLDAIGVFREALENDRHGQAALAAELDRKQALVSGLEQEVASRFECRCAICLHDPAEVVCIPMFFLTSKQNGLFLTSPSNCFFSNFSKLLL